MHSGRFSYSKKGKLAEMTTRCHSLSLFLPLVVIRCSSLYQLLSLVVTRCIARPSFSKQSHQHIYVITASLITSLCFWKRSCISVFVKTIQTNNSYYIVKTIFKVQENPKCFFIYMDTFKNYFLSQIKTYLYGHIS